MASRRACALARLGMNFLRGGMQNPVDSLDQSQATNEDALWTGSDEYHAGGESLVIPEDENLNDG
jgi:hypothetical protein